MDHDELIEFADQIGLPTHGDAPEVLARIVMSSREFSDF
jgi:hypothetical protein